jgi:hypothetical protein
MHLVLSFFAFMHLHFASHIDTLDASHEGRDVGAKPEDGVWWIYPKDRTTARLHA